MRLKKIVLWALISSLLGVSALYATGLSFDVNKPYDTATVSSLPGYIREVKLGLFDFGTGEHTALGEHKIPTSTTAGLASLTPGAGRIVYDSTTGALKYGNGTGWVGTNGAITVPYSLASILGTNLTTVIAGFGATQTTFVIDAVMTLSSHTTVPVNVELIFIGAGAINLGNYDLTLNCPIRAGPQKIFNYTGSGVVNRGSTGPSPIITEWWGAYGDGIADDNVAVSRAITSCGVYPTTIEFLNNRTYPTAVSSWIFPSNTLVLMDSGARLSVATSRTITINGTFQAGLEQAFICAGTGKIDFARGACSYVCPEWWYSGTGSYHTALNAAYLAYTGTYTPDPGSGVTCGYVSVLLSKMYTITNNPWTMDTKMSGQIRGVGKGISGIYQSGTGAALNMALGGAGPVTARNPHLTLRSFSIIGNPTSTYGITTTACALRFEDMDILSNGSHGFYCSQDGWQMTFRDVFSNYNGGDGFKWTHIGDALQFAGGGATYNTGIGLNLAVASLSKAVLITMANINYNTGGGAYLAYGQYNVVSNYFEGNTGIQVDTFGLRGGQITGNNFYNGLGSPTIGVRLNSNTAIPENQTFNTTVSGNIFSGMATANCWSSGSALGCMIGPNYAYTGSDILYDDTDGWHNHLVNQLGSRRDPFLVLLYDTTITMDMAKSNAFTVTSTNGAGFQINNPLHATEGQLVTLTIVNSSGGALGTITWDTQFKLAGGTFTSPATGYCRTITFRAVDVGWADKLVEVTRSAGDTAR
jgi:hypothetical protein